VHGYLRATTEKDLKTMLEIHERCMQGAALATGCSYKAEQHELLFGDLYDTPTGSKLLCDIFDDMGEKWTKQDKPGASTDAGLIDYDIPVFHPQINIAPEGQHGAVGPALHTPEFCALVQSKAAEKALKNAATLLAELVYRLATEPATLESVRRENAEYRHSAA
jgi:metal-dependent amidase/aminoacylase/carboxypeptidase family protein